MLRHWRLSVTVMTAASPGAVSAVLHAVRAARRLGRGLQRVAVAPVGVVRVHGPVTHSHRSEIVLSSTENY